MRRRSVSCSNATRSNLSPINLCLSVVGLSGSDKVKGVDGVGKSAICNRLTSPYNYRTRQTKLFSTLDFYGELLNGSHWIYWGFADLQSEYRQFRYHVVEQTVIINEQTCVPFEDYSLSEYLQNCAGGSVRGPKRSVSVGTEDSPTTAAVMSDEQVIVHGLVVVYDVSAVSQRDTQLQDAVVRRLLRNALKHHRPVIVAAAKMDQACPRQQKRLSNLLGSKASLRSVAVIETSALRNINIWDILLYFSSLYCQRWRSCMQSKRRIESFSTACKRHDKIAEARLQDLQSSVRSAVVKHYDMSFSNFCGFTEIRQFLSVMNLAELKQRFQQYHDSAVSTVQESLMTSYRVLLKKLVHEFLNSIADLEQRHADNITSDLLDDSRFLNNFEDDDEDEVAAMRRAYLSGCGPAYPLPRFLFGQLTGVVAECTVDIGKRRRGRERLAELRQWLREKPERCLDACDEPGDNVAEQERQLLGRFRGRYFRRAKRQFDRQLFGEADTWLVGGELHSDRLCSSTFKWWEQQWLDKLRASLVDKEACYLLGSWQRCQERLQQQLMFPSPGRVAAAASCRPSRLLLVLCEEALQDLQHGQLLHHLTAALTRLQRPSSGEHQLVRCGDLVCGAEDTSDPESLVVPVILEGSVLSKEKLATLTLSRRTTVLCVSESSTTVQWQSTVSGRKQLRVPVSCFNSEAAVADWLPSLLSAPVDEKDNIGAEAGCQCRGSVSARLWLVLFCRDEWPQGLLPGLLARLLYRGRVLSDHVTSPRLCRLTGCREGFCRLLRLEVVSFHQAMQWLQGKSARETESTAITMLYCGNRSRLDSMQTGTALAAHCTARQRHRATIVHCVLCAVECAVETVPNVVNVCGGGGDSDDESPGDSTDESSGDGSGGALIDITVADSRCTALDQAGSSVRLMSRSRPQHVEYVFIDDPNNPDADQLQSLWVAIRKSFTAETEPQCRYNEAFETEDTNLPRDFNWNYFTSNSPPTQSQSSGPQKKSFNFCAQQRKQVSMNSCTLNDSDDSDVDPLNIVFCDTTPCGTYNKMKFVLIREESQFDDGGGDSHNNEALPGSSIFITQCTNPCHSEMAESPSAAFVAPNQDQSSLAKCRSFSGPVRAEPISVFGRSRGSRRQHLHNGCSSRCLPPLPPLPHQQCNLARHKSDTATPKSTALYSPTSPSVTGNGGSTSVSSGTSSRSSFKSMFSRLFSSSERYNSKTAEDKRSIFRRSFKFGQKSSEKKNKNAHSTQETLMTRSVGAAEQDSAARCHVTDLRKRTKSMSTFKN